MTRKETICAVLTCFLFGAPLPGPERACANDEAAPAPNQSLEQLRLIVERQQLMIEDQQRRLEKLEKMLGEIRPNPEPSIPAQRAPAGEKPARSSRPVTLYGFVRADLEVDTRRMSFDSQLPFYVLSAADPSQGLKDSGDVTLHPRLSRFGLELTDMKFARGWGVTGKLEADFFNAFIEQPGPARREAPLAPDNPAPARDLVGNARAALRIRHAYVRLHRGDWHVLMGQTWDVISPLFPSVNADTMMWNAGNTADRRPQLRVGYEPPHGEGKWSLVGMVGSSGAVDGQDLDGDGFRDGEAAGSPTLQARIGYRSQASGQAWAVGLFAHRARQQMTRFSFAGRRRFVSSLAGADLSLPLGRSFKLEGELWAGKNLSDVRGGIGQGIDRATGREVRARGGWLEASYQMHLRYGIHLGAALDSPHSADLSTAAARTRNRIYYLTNRIRLAEGLTLGLDYARWTTEFKALPAGKNNRFTLFFQKDF